MSEIEITINGNEVRKYPKNITYYEITKQFTKGNKVLGVIANNKLVSLHDKVDRNQKITLLDNRSTTGNRIYVAGLKIVFEYALKKAFPSMSLSYSYSLPRGIVAEIDNEKYLTNEDVDRIRREMAKIVSDDIVIEKLVIKNSDGIAYYEELNNKCKAENIKNIVDPTVIMYRLEDILNYYYSEMPYSTGVINQYEIRYLGRNTIVINYPTETDGGKTPEYVNYKGILDSYKKGKEWLNIMNVPYINGINKLISSGKIANFIRSSEYNFNLEINETAKFIAKNSNIKCVMISGPSSSGKTTVTKRIGSYFELYGLDPIVISIDDYFHERENTPRDANGEKDFECLQATDIDYLTSDVIKLFNGEEVSLPKYNFITGRKEASGKKVKMKDNSIILFEGLHAINDGLLPLIPDTIKYKIYVSPFIPLCIDQHNYISLNDLRLIRRMVRDFRTRGSSVENTLKHWRKVRIGEEKNIIPFVHQADKIINTSLPYELGVLKVIAGPLLYSVDSSSEYYNEARRLLNFLKQFFTINSEYVPLDSIVREFIGGDKND